MGQNQSGPGGAPGEAPKKDQVGVRVGPQARKTGVGSSPYLHHLLLPALANKATKPLQEKKKKWEPPAPPPRVGRKQKKRDQVAGLGTKLPTVTPNAKCKLRLLKLERVKDYLLMEEEFVKTQELLKPQEERNEEDRTKVRVSWHSGRKRPVEETWSCDLVPPTPAWI